MLGGVEHLIGGLVVRVMVLLLNCDLVQKVGASAAILRLLIHEARVRRSLQLLT